MMNEQLSQLFDLADELRRRIVELAEMVANPPAQARVLKLHRKATARGCSREPEDLGSMPPSI
ncbi:hypothetical protein K2Z84_32000 [Candidatus Binatia bacterium]|nr:hypothetical protein [Candidatus Binatia bacterium]